MRAVHGLLRGPRDDEEKKGALMEATKALARAIRDLSGCSELIKADVSEGYCKGGDTVAEGLL